jgi:hypothetical protein
MIGRYATATTEKVRGAAPSCGVRRSSQPHPASLRRSVENSAFRRESGKLFQQAYCPRVTQASQDHSDTVDQAVGMVSIQAACSVADAFDLMERRAWSMDKPVEDIADAVVDRRIRFADHG